MPSLSSRLARAVRTPAPDRVILDLGQWTPDQPDLGGSVTEALNCIAHARGYKQFLGLSMITDALTARAQGAVAAIDSAGNTRPYAGDASKLYRLEAGAWSDSSKSGGYACPADDMWEFTVFGQRVIACNIIDPLQSITMGGSAFADLAASTLKPKARHIATIGEFVVLGNVDEGGTIYPDRLRWSAINDPTDYDQSASTQSDSQDLPDGGWIQRLVGGRSYGIVFQERAIRRMTYEGSPLIFRVDKVEDGRGAYLPYAVVPYGATVFYIADDGFYAFVGDSSQPIGKNRIDKFFFDDLNETYRSRVVGAIDRDNSIVMWVYPSQSSSGEPDSAILYNWRDDKWSRAEFDCEMVFTSLTAGYTLDELDTVSSSLDALPFSLDSRIWTGGATALAAFDTSHKLGYFSGSALAARIDTGEMQLARGRRSHVSNVRPLVDGSSATVTVQVGSRNKQGEAESFGSALSLESEGHANADSDARYHRFRLNISGGFTDAVGIEAEATPSGQY